MTIDAYTITVPVFVRSLGALSALLGKAEAWSEAHRVDPAVLPGCRLIADMYPLARQVQTACDFAKNATARVAGVEAPAFADDETTLAELRARIDRTLAVLGGIDPALVAAAAGRTIEFPMGPGKRGRMEATAYLLHYALPNFHFHLVTAYGILRANGVEIGKPDFLGAVPGLEFV